MKIGSVTRAVSVAAVLGSAVWGLTAANSALGSTVHVRLVGTFNGVHGAYSTIQAAVNAAQPGDWILVGPGDYHERQDYAVPSWPAGVWIHTPGLHLRGMNRNSVIVDGTKPGSAPCSSNPAAQDLGPKAQGRNGIEVYGPNNLANNVSIDNLTVCNFLTSASGGNGNEVWWNGGDGGGHVGMFGYTGSYLTATSTYSSSKTASLGPCCGVDFPAGSYGIFSSDASRGLWTYSYASNMSDSGYYVGGCQQLCHAVLNHDHAQYSSLCLSSTNAGGYILVEHMECDLNKTGLVSNSQNNDDWPSPQNGSCPTGVTGPIPTATTSCTVWAYNNLHDNNNPNVPGNGTSGLAGGGPVGTGLILAGTNNVTLYKNNILNNDAWGELIVDLPDQEQAPSDAQKAGDDCRGGTVVPIPGQTEICYYRAQGNMSLANVFTNDGNGFPGQTAPNAGNGDIGLATAANNPGNCFAGDTETLNNLTTDPPAMESNPAYQPTNKACTTPNSGDMAVTGSEALCSSQLVAPCPTTLCQFNASLPCIPLPGGYYYPRASSTFKLTMPAKQTTMPNPCVGVPTNLWCSSGVPVSHGGVGVAGLAAMSLAPAAAAGLGIRRRLHRRGAA